jgi:hypothetical protein
MIFYSKTNNPNTFFPDGRMTMEYVLKFRDGGVWMPTNDFIALVKELGDRFGIDASVQAAGDGIIFYLREKQDQ